MRNKTIYGLLLVTVFLTNMSQYPGVNEIPGAKLVSYLPWVLLLCTVLYACFRGEPFRLGNQLYMLALPLLILGICLFQEIMGLNGLGVILLLPVLMCVFIYVVSMNAGYHLEENSLRWVLMAYAISGALLTAGILIHIRIWEFNWDSYGYAFESKNSAAQIILTAVFALIYIRGKDQKKISLLLDIAMCVMVVSLFVLKSRATLVGLFLMFVFILLGKDYSKNTKRIAVLVTVVFAGLMIFHAGFRKTMVESIFFANREVTDLDAISSGRITQLSKFPERFFQHPLLGHGRAYVECMMLDAFLETGLIGGIMFNILAFAPVLYSARRYLRERMPVDYVLLVMSSCYYLNGLFEQQAPFGPGVKCYFIWMLFGLSVAFHAKHDRKNRLTAAQMIR